MKRIIGIVALALILPATVFAANLAQTLQPTDTLAIAANQCNLAVMSQSPAAVSVACGPLWTPTALPATATPVGNMAGQPCTPSTHPATGWHPPVHVVSGCYFQHEHGDVPPPWVPNPFTQTRELHVGYKGVAKTSQANSVESYFIAHIVSTEAARSHGDHDFELWVKDPSGGLSHWAGVLDFGTPPPERIADNQLRPIIVSVSANPDGGACETWYSRPGAAIVDVGWTICGRHEGFTGTLMGGLGTYRGADWVLPYSRLGNSAFPGTVAPTLAQYAALEFSVYRFSWIDAGRQFPGTGVVGGN
jgi:hypothetical protein